MKIFTPVRVFLTKLSVLYVVMEVVELRTPLI